MNGVISRPETRFDGASHTYSDATGERLWGISSIAKMGEAEDSFSVGSAWGFRLGYEGTWDLLTKGRDQGLPGDPVVRLPRTKDRLRTELQLGGLTPWGTRDRAANRGNWAHDLLEALATDGTVPTLDLLASVDEEHRGHGRAILQWYLDFRPSFVATEVQVTSEAHGFAGRYDIRCHVRASRLLKLAEVWLPEGHLVRERIQALALLRGDALSLVDLKTSKRIYPVSHFVQLEGYELAGVEMGFPPTDVRFVLNTHPDGTYDIGIGYATAQDFLGYLGAYKAMKGLKELDPEKRREREVQEAVKAHLPGLSRDIAGQPGCPETAMEVGRVLGKLRKSRTVRQGDDKIWHLVSASTNMATGRGQTSPNGAPGA